MQGNSYNKNWINKVLLALSAYSILFGLFVLIFPTTFYILANIQTIPNPPLWQSIALFSILLGFGYGLASNNPLSNWAIIATGTATKIIASTYWLVLFAQGQLPIQSVWLLIINLLIWLPPLIYMLYIVYNRSFFNDNAMIALLANDNTITLNDFETSHGSNLNEMTHRSPTLLVFLRHFGCTFCREALQDLSKKRNNIEIKGTRIALVHMVDYKTAQSELEKYGLSDIPHISDPENILYKKFKLKNGTVSQLLGLKVLFRGLISGAVRKYGIGKELGNSMQMPGIFLMHKGQIVKFFIHQSAADRPNYEDLAFCTM